MKSNQYDLAFLKWFARHGVKIVSSPMGLHVSTNNDAVCQFRITPGMVERLLEDGHLKAVFPPRQNIFTDTYVLNDEPPVGHIERMYPPVIYGPWRTA